MHSEWRPKPCFFWDNRNLPDYEADSSLLVHFSEAVVSLKRVSQTGGDDFEIRDDDNGPLMTVLKLAAHEVLKQKTQT